MLDQLREEKIKGFCFCFYFYITLLWCSPFVYVVSSFWLTNFLLLEVLWTFLARQSLLLSNSLHFCLSENALISSPLLKDNVTDYRILDGWGFLSTFEVQGLAQTWVTIFLQNQPYVLMVTAPFVWADKLCQIFYYKGISTSGDDCVMKS